MDDLFNQSVYKLKVGENDYCLVPLWHSELIYDKHNLQVQCEPELPENVQLDEYNNVHIFMKYIIGELWSKNIIEIKLGSQTFEIQVETLRIKREQYVVLEKKGIPVPNSVNIFSVLEISDVYVHIEFT